MNHLLDAMKDMFWKGETPSSQEFKRPPAFGEDIPQQHNSPLVLRAKLQRIVISREMFSVHDWLLRARTQNVTPNRPTRLEKANHKKM